MLKEPGSGAQDWPIGSPCCAMLRQIDAGSHVLVYLPMLRPSGSPDTSCYPPAVLTFWFKNVGRPGRFPRTCHGKRLLPVAPLPASLPTCLPAYLPTCLPTCLPAYLPSCLPSCLPPCLAACLAACLPAYLLTCLPAYLPACLPTYLPTCLPTCLPAYLPTCLPAYLPA